MSRLSRALARLPLPLLTAYAAGCAFCVYFGMYAFRKPFDATTFTGFQFFGTKIELKTACVIAQILGYMTSKYLGTKICSEVRAEFRMAWMIGLILFAELALLLFAVSPHNAKPAAMFLNGLPLGMIWGLCVRYLEGRRTSEIMVAGLSCSYIIAGAATRDVGVDVVIRTWGYSEQWMPAITGGLFFGPFLVALLLLNQLPPPSQADIQHRSERQPMTNAQRRAFLRHFGLGFVLLLTAYFFLTAFRDFRDHYGKEIFNALGLGDVQAIFSRTEKWAMFGVILAMALLNSIRNHRWALVAVYGVIVFGFSLLGVATLLFQAAMISGYTWMVCLGVGLYLAYVPYGAVLFERMMAASRFSGTAVFAIQLADAIGYTGSVMLQLIRDLFFGQFDRLAFIQPFALITSAVGAVLMLVSGVMVLKRLLRADQKSRAAPTP